MSLKISNNILVLPFLILLLMFNFLIAGTTGKISGIVTDSENGEPLPGTNVVLEGQYMGAATGLDGYYVILNIPPGEYTVQVSMIGYQTETMTNVRVSIDRTINLNFALKDAPLEITEEIVVVADREKIRPDVSFTQTSMNIEEMKTVPVSPDLREVIAFAPGVYRNDRGQLEIRGGQMDEVGMYVDGISMQNSRTGVGVLNLPQAGIEEIQIIRGGFSAEYGQAQAGVINVVTKESQKEYHGSLNARYGPAQQKHFGPNVFSPENEYHVGRFLSMDPVYRSIPWTGEENTLVFQGWNNWWADSTIEKTDRYHPERTFPYGTTAEEAREIWMWRHREQKYGDEPDYTVDGTFSGPIPFTADKLSLFISGHYDRSIYPFKFSRPDFTEKAFNGKLIYKINNSMKLAYHNMYSSQSGAIFTSELGSTNMADARHWLSSARVMGRVFGSSTSNQTGMYNGDGQTKTSELEVINHTLKFDYTLNNSSYLKALATYSKTQEGAKIDLPFRDFTNIVKVIGGDSLDLAPLFPVNRIGSNYVSNNDILDAHSMGGISGVSYFDDSINESVILKADYTNQINKIHMIQAGLWGMHTNIKLNYGVKDAIHTIDGVEESFLKKEWFTREIPYSEFALYVQDKAEYQGLVLNVGFRLDGMYNNEQDFPDFHSYYNNGFISDSLYLIPESDAPRGNLKLYLSPRIGVSHPLTENSKLFFNYGYFYQRATIAQLFSNNYKIDYSGASLSGLSSANLNFRKTIQYELGYEQMVNDWFRITVSGYYRDISNTLDRTTLTNIDLQVYSRFYNTGFGEVRGFEVDVRVPRHLFISGWANYDYRSKSTGAYGYEYYAEEISVGRIEEKDPKATVTRAQPNFRANITLYSPEFEKSQIMHLLLADWQASFLYQWRSGKYITWHENEDLNQTDPFNLQWEAFTRLDLRVSKLFNIGETQLSLYMDVRNLLNEKYFHPELLGNLNSNRDYTKFTSEDYFKAIDRLGLKPGNVEHPEIKSMLEQSAYWIFYGEPRQFWFGAEFSF